MLTPRHCHAARVTRFVQAVLATLLSAAAVAGCSAGPSHRPAVVVVDSRLPAAQTSTAEAVPPTFPALQAPVADLAWSDCTASTVSKLAITSKQPGLVLECANLTVNVDAKLSTKLRLGLLRARLASTPRDAAPLVLTTGAEQPATTFAATLAASGTADILATRPLVALDRRGLGTSSPLSCLKVEQRSGIENVDPGAPPPSDTLAATLALGQDATEACTDVLSPAELAYDTSHAITDLEALRVAWKVDKLALLGLGNGAAVALRYAVAHPQQVSRLILDSPAAPGADEVSAAKNQATGAEAAFVTFASRCLATACAVGPDPQGTVIGLMQRARTSGGLTSSDGRRMSAGAVLRSVRQALLTPQGLDGLAPALASAGAGDARALLTYLDLAAGRQSRSDPGTQIDATLVAGCSDASLRPTPEQVSTLVAQWGKDFPLFGADSAARLLLCLAWPTPATAPAVRALGAVPPTLVLSATADPVTGPLGGQNTVTSIQQAGSDATLLGWQGAGHPVFASSACARSAVNAYVLDGTQPTQGTICPP